MINGTPNLHGGLQKVAEDLGCQRIGPMHQGGSDSLITCDAFFKLCEMLGTSPVAVEDDHKFVNELYGLGGNSTVYRPPPREEATDGDYD